MPVLNLRNSLPPFSSPSRILPSDNQITWGWPGCYAEWRCQGTSVRISLDNGGRNAILLLDGVLASQISAAAGTQTIEIALKPGIPHILRLQDICEEWRNEATLYKIECEGKWLPPPPPRPLFFEFIGDSWTAGWGNLSSEQLVSDCTQGYAALLANHFRADYALIAAAGQGVVKNFGDTPPSPLCLTQQTRWTLPAQPGDWTPQRPADWVFVLVGENDHSFPPWPSTLDFRNNLRQILADARQRSPQAHIALICVDRPHCNPERIREVHAAEKAEGLDTLLLECPNFSDEYPLGYLWHPGVEHHRELAKQLAKQLESQM